MSDKNNDEFVLDDEVRIMKNPYIIILGISEYEDENQSLPFVKTDINNMMKLWRDKYKYQYISCASDIIKKKT